MITWFQVAYIGAKLVQTNGSFGPANGKAILTPIETGDNETEYCDGLTAYHDIESPINMTVV
jgi:hypothetical protein